MKKKDNESITAALYHLNLAYEYMGVFKLDCADGAKGRAINWERKLKWVLDDIFASLEPKSRELYRQEILQGDPIFIGAMAQHLLTMTPEQRDQIEKIAEGIAGGKISQLEFISDMETADQQ